MNKNFTKLLLIAFLLQPFAQSAQASILQPYNPQRYIADLGNLSYINFGSVWRDKVELYSLESDNKFQTFTCGRDLSVCKVGELEKPEGAISYQGNINIQTLLDNDSHSIYKLITNDQELIIPYIQKSTIKVSRNETAAILFNNDEVFHFEIDSEIGKKIDIEGIPDLVNILVSPSGGYVSGYDSDEGSFVIVNLIKEESHKIKADNYKNLNYAEISEDDNFLALVNDMGSHDQLEIYSLNNTGEPKLLKKLTVENETTDYIFLGNQLFYITNSDHPYEWTMWSYNPDTQAKQLISGNVVMDGSMRIVDDKLIYRAMDGLGSSMYTVSISDDSQILKNKVFGTNPNPNIKNIVYTKITAPNPVVKGVLMQSNEVADKPNKETDLLIWLHGGPQSQARAGIHDRRVYGQYDQLFENLVVNEDIRILKLDYPGSIGFGTDYTESLLENIGITDVAAVKDASTYINEEYKIKDTHLIGLSYGGYLVFKSLVEQPDLFTNAIVISGASDWKNDFERDLTGGLSFITRLDEDKQAQQYEESNVLDKIDQLNKRTKLTMYVGLNDNAVKPLQSHDVVDALRKNNHKIKESKVIEFDNEGHVIGFLENLEIIYKNMVQYFAE